MSSEPIPNGVDLAGCVTGTYKACFVAFLDILGFRSKVLDSEENTQTLANIIQSLKIVNAIPSGGKQVSSAQGKLRTIQFQSRFFSDSLVFFLKEEPRDVAQLFFVIRFIQDRLWEKGICLRGSIVRGRMYWTDREQNITLGQGLIDAHERETTLAIFPRVVITDDLYNYLRVHQVDAKPFGAAGLIENFICRDSDGICFLDLLHPQITRPQGEQFDGQAGQGQFTIRFDPIVPSNQPAMLTAVDQVIRGNDGRLDDRTKQKLAWLRSYWNRYKTEESRQQC